MVTCPESDDFWPLVEAAAAAAGLTHRADNPKLKKESWIYSLGCYAASLKI